MVLDEIRNQSGKVRASGRNTEERAAAVNTSKPHECEKDRQEFLNHVKSLVEWAGRDGLNLPLDFIPPRAMPLGQPDTSPTARKVKEILGPYDPQMHSRKFDSPREASRPRKPSK